MGLFENRITGLGYLLSARFRIILLLCLGITMQGIMRFNINMAVVCMVNVSGEASVNQTDETANDYTGEFTWSSFQIGWLYAVFYWGSLVSVLPTGYFADKWNPKWLLFGSTAACVALTAVTPVAAKAGIGWAMAVRFLMGVAQGGRLPCMSAILAKWVPAAEMSFAVAMGTAGQQLSVVVTMPTAAAMCTAKSFWGGWPSIFYVAAIAGTVWCVTWMLCATNRADECKMISGEERAYILRTLKVDKQPPKFIPWKAILLSMPVWAVILASFAATLNNYIMSMYLPLFLQQVAHVTLIANGFLSAVPSLAQWVGKLALSHLSDHLRARKPTGKISQKLLAPTFLSKLFNSIGMFGMGIFLIAVTVSSLSNAGLVTLLLCLGMLLSAGYTPGFRTSTQVLAPPYAGTIQALTSLSASISSVVTPYIALIAADGSESSWKAVLFLVAGVEFLVGFFYAIFASAVRCKWADTAAAGCTEQKLDKLPELIVVRF